MLRKKAILLKSKETSAGSLQNRDARPRRQARERLKPSILEDLWSIWRNSPRVPSIKSRRAWAIARDASPCLVDGWFLRRKTCAKKAGQPLLEGMYDLPLDAPMAPKRELSATPAVFPDLPSDDTLVYPSDGEYLNHLEASSDTAFDVSMPVDWKGEEKRAYKEVPQPETHAEDCLFQSQPRFGEVLFSHAINFLWSSPADGDGSSFDLSFPVCNQGWGRLSDFTCILCSKASDQGTPDEVRSDSSIADWRGSACPPCPRLNFFPDILSELSAIPFLSRTPPAMHTYSPVRYPSVDDWTIVEEELGRLVNQGGLDFSFLDDPGFALMELFH